MRRFGFISTFLTVLLGISIAVTGAQGNCPQLVREALDAVDTNCDETGRNQACYGYNQVEASFLQSIPDDFFSQPSDVTDLAELETIRTAPLRLDDGTWGVAVVSAQANVPNSLPGQSVTFVLLGDVEMENAVDPDEALAPVDPIDVESTVRAGANIRSGPATNFNVLGGAVPGTTLPADGLSPDGEWLRIVYKGRPAWIARSVVSSEGDLDSLPVLTPELRSPMQAFYLRTGIGQPECAEVVDDALIIQGPENIEVSLTINGAEVFLGSTGLVYVVEIDGELFLEWIVIDGYFIVDGVRIEAGQIARQPLGEQDGTGVNPGTSNLVVTGPPSPPETIDVCEAGWETIEQVPASILNYAIDVTCADELPPAPPPSSPPVVNVPPQQEDLCASISMNVNQIIATNINLSWSGPAGYLYEVAAIDENGYQVNTVRTTERSIPLNGGTFFPSKGAAHIRLYTLDGDYLCFAEFTFTRGADPNEPPGGYPPDNPLEFSAYTSSCEFGDGYWYGYVHWQNAPDDVEIRIGEAVPPPLYTTTMSRNGSTSFYVEGTAETILKIRLFSGDEAVYIGCNGTPDPPPPPAEFSAFLTACSFNPSTSIWSGTVNWTDATGTVNVEAGESVLIGVGSSGSQNGSLSFSAEGTGSQPLQVRVTAGTDVITLSCSYTPPALTANVQGCMFDPLNSTWSGTISWNGGNGSVAINAGESTLVNVANGSGLIGSTSFSTSGTGTSSLQIQVVSGAETVNLACSYTPPALTANVQGCMFDPLNSTWSGTVNWSGGNGSVAVNAGESTLVNVANGNGFSGSVGFSTSGTGTASLQIQVVSGAETVNLSCSYTPPPFTASVQNCAFDDVETFDWSGTVTWNNALLPVTIEIGEFEPLQDYGTFNTFSGNLPFTAIGGESSTLSIRVTSGANVVNLSCTYTPPPAFNVVLDFCDLGQAYPDWNISVTWTDAVGDVLVYADEFDPMMVLVDQSTQVNGNSTFTVGSETWSYMQVIVADDFDSFYFECFAPIGSP